MPMRDKMSADVREIAANKTPGWRKLCPRADGRGRLTRAPNGGSIATKETNDMNDETIPTEDEHPEMTRAMAEVAALVAPHVHADDEAGS